MVLRDAAGLAYGVVGVGFLWIATLAWCRRTHNPTVALSLAVTMVALAVASIADAVAYWSVHERTAAVASLALVPGLGVATGAMVCLGYGVARPHKVPRPRYVLLLLVEPLLVTLAVATNPSHLWVYDGDGAARMTGSADWGYGPVMWVHAAYCYATLLVGVSLLAWGWRDSPPRFRHQRLALAAAALVGAVPNIAYLFRALGPGVDPTPFGFAVSGALLTFALFRRDLVTLNPVARGLIVDQIGDAILVLSLDGHLLDLNPAAADLVRAVRPDAPRDLVGQPADRLLAGLLAPDGARADVVVAAGDRRIELEVRASPLLDRHRRPLGQVLVARDVTVVNAQARSLAAANERLVHQIEVIDGLRSELADLATHDSLTGLHNRRHMVERFACMVAQAQDADEPLAVVLLDVDLFKEINDRHGHLVGDEVLVALAGRIAGQAPDRALVARWGGEEFFIAVPGADAAEGLAVAEQVRRRCQDDPITVSGRAIACTLSGGVAAYPDSGTSTSLLFQAADVALYEAKRSGRNVVRVHSGAVVS